MSNFRALMAGGVCLLVLGGVAAALWLQDGDSGVFNNSRAGETADRAKSATSVPVTSANRGPSAKRDGDDLPSETKSATETPEEDSDPVVREESDSVGAAVSPGMPVDHGLGREMPGWMPRSDVSEIQAIEIDNNSKAVAYCADFAGLGTDSYTRSRAWRKHRDHFDPASPNGVLLLSLHADPFTWMEEDAPDAFEATLIRTRDRATWYVTQSDGDSVRLTLPVEDGDTFQIQLRTEDGRTALGYLPMLGGARRGGMRRTEGIVNLYRCGSARFHLRLISPGQQPRARSVFVKDENGAPVQDAVILQRGQEFGRSDTDGIIEWPFPPASSPHDTGQRGFLLYAPGYVPIFLPREEVSDSQSPRLEVTLKAREFVARLWGGTVDERFMYFLANTQSLSIWAQVRPEIQSLGWDLLPLAPEAKVESWEDAFYYLAFHGHGRDKWEDLRETSPSHDYEPVGRVRRSPTARPWTKNWGGGWQSPSWGDGLEEAVGRPYHELWPDYYGGWYLRRWRYDGGNFEVVLPYPGKFLLLVGEEYREGMNGSKPGQINLVLYIDARDPGDVKGQLFRAPE